MFEHIELFIDNLSENLGFFVALQFFKMDDLLCFLLSFGSSNDSSNLTLFILLEVSGCTSKDLYIK